MALSGSLNTSDYSGRYYKLSWTATQSVANNTSTISWTLEALGGSASWYAERTLNVVIAGTTVYSKTSRVERYTGVIETGTITLSHNSDGTKNFTASVDATVYYSSGINCTGSSTFTLNTIARASSITSASNVTLGNSCSVKWTPASTSFYYKLKFSLGSWNNTVSVGNPGTTSAYTYSSYTIPLTVANQLPSATTGTMTVYLYTYSSSDYSTQIGSTSSKTFTITVPSSIKPTLNSATVTIDNSANSVVKGWNLYVDGYSKAKITVGSSDVSGTYGSSINSFTISGGYSKTVTGTTLSYTGSALSSGSKTFYVVANDSRSRSSEKVTAKTSDGKESITVYSYSKPSVSSFKVSRSSDNNKQIVVKANWSYSSVNGKNSATATLYYKKSTSDTWISYNGEVLQDSSTTLNVEFEEASSYNFKLTVTDSLSNSTSYETSTSTIQVLMDFRAGGKGLGIGKICESNALEVSMQSKFYNSIYLSDDYEIRSLNSDGSSRSILKGISSEGNTILGYGNYAEADANTNIYGNDINIFSAAAGDASYRPYYRSGDVIDIDYIRTAGFLTSDKTQISFVVPIDRPIIGEPTITASSIDGFILRQDGNYTHGSESSKYISPSYYTVLNYGSYGITVRAEFSTTTNSVNNAPIGIHWSGRITLS